MAVYRKMAWTCPRCETENLGPVRTCEGCQAPQPADVKFHQTEGAQIVTDAKEIAAASKGPDVHCAYCGTRNPADADTCSQCGVGLAEATPRGPSKSYHDDPANNQHVVVTMGSVDSSNRRNPSRDTSNYHLVSTRGWSDYIMEHLPQIGLILGGLMFCFLLVWLIWMTFFNVKPETVVIQGFSWTASQAVEKYDWVQKFDQSTEPPVGARYVVMHLETTGYAQKDSCVNAGQKDVPTGREYKCGEGWENQENGYEKKVPTMCPETEKVQVTACTKVDDLTKPTEVPLYDYQIQEWIFAYSRTNTGADQNPIWPKPELGVNQRYGSQSQQFIVDYVDKNEVSHSETRWWMHDLPWFQSLIVGQRCVAKRNGFGLLNPGIDCSVQP